MSCVLSCPSLVDTIKKINTINSLSDIPLKCGYVKPCFFFLLGFLQPKSGQENEVAEYPYKDMGEMIVKRGIVVRGIVEQCCHKPCNIFELQNYCASLRS